MNLYTKFVSYGLVGHNTVYHMFIENFVDQEVVIPYLLQELLERNLLFPQHCQLIIDHYLRVNPNSRALAWLLELELVVHFMSIRPGFNLFLRLQLSRENTEEVHAVLSKMVLLRLLLAPETLSWVVKYYFGTEKERLKDWLFIVKLGEVSNNAVFEQLLDEMFKPDHCMTLSLFCSFVQALKNARYIRLAVQKLFYFVLVSPRPQYYLTLEDVLLCYPDRVHEMRPSVFSRVIDYLIDSGTPENTAWVIKLLEKHKLPHFGYKWETFALEQAKTGAFKSVFRLFQRPRCFSYEHVKELARLANQQLNHVLYNNLARMLSINRGGSDLYDQSGYLSSILISRKYEACLEVALRNCEKAGDLYTPLILFKLVAGEPGLRLPHIMYRNILGLLLKVKRLPNSLVPHCKDRSVQALPHPVNFGDSAAWKAPTAF
ncbi:uncharacterized protein LOC135144493 [Zophobas morio]|uniref:uncharacterized protein LOC135144493 n=1 Tax=Zophobas morio TaxID=2755281 RepID=UPI003082ECC4